MLKILLVLSFSFFITASSCQMQVSSNSNKETDRKQEITERDSNGRIRKTFDGFVYRHFDEKGRLEEYYGNFKRSDNNSNFRTKIYFTDSLVEVKYFIMDDENIKCIIQDPADYFLHKYFYSNGQLVRSENYKPVKNRNGKVTGHQLVESSDTPTINPYMGKIPSYLE